MASTINVNYLLAVWGESYIRQFMDLSLRTLLSEGNIPGLARHTRSRFVFLTRAADRTIFTNHPLYKRLSHYCDVEFIAIDDLIFNGNYSATLTLAYERGMRAAGKEMLSSYFIYLVADYVMADGSLRNLLPYMQRNISGITAGNFQTVEEDMLALLQERVDETTGVLSLPARELISLSLPHLHPVTAANVANQGYSHTHHTNRLFWRVDDNTMVGRFYLRHMLCIKPEIDNYIIGASCDYSYIAEMCPSGNVAHIADSDEYCVIELQPFSHEREIVSSGPLQPEKLVASLGEWTTRNHRDNAFLPIIFHAGDINEEAYAMVESSRELVETIDARLSSQPLPIRGHPYWISCIEGILENLGKQIDNKKETKLIMDITPHFRLGIFAGIIGSPVFEPPLGEVRGDYHLLKTKHFRFGHEWRHVALRLIRRLSGDQAQATLWHRDFAHSRAIKEVITSAAGENTNILLISPEPTSYAEWCRKKFNDRVLPQHADLFCLRSDLFSASQAVILLPVTHMSRLGSLLARCNICLTGDRKITIILTQRYFTRKNISFKHQLAALSSYYFAPFIEEISITTISNPLRRRIDRQYQKQVSVMMGSSISLRGAVRRILPMLVIIASSVGYLVGNLLSRRSNNPHKGRPTCAIITLKLRSIDD